MCVGFHVKYRYSCQILMKLNLKSTQISNNLQVGAELFRAERQTDRRTDSQTDMTKVAMLRTRFKIAETVSRHCATL